MAKKKKSWSSDSIDSKMVSSENTEGGSLEAAVSKPAPKKAQSGSSVRAKFLNQANKRHHDAVNAAMDALDNGGDIGSAVKSVPADARGAVKAYGRAIA